MAFLKFTAPNLPAPPSEYDSTYFDQLMRQLNTYFNIHNSQAGLGVDNITAKILQLPYASYTAVNGSTNDVSLPAATFINIVGPTAAFTFTGITSGTTAENNGRMLTLFNNTAQNMTLVNESASSTAAYRITTCTGANIVTVGQGVVTLVYISASNAAVPTQVTSSRWVVVSSQL